jgi:hypothetical protein
LGHKADSVAKIVLQLFSKQNTVLLTREYFFPSSATHPIAHDKVEFLALSLDPCIKWRGWLSDYENSSFRPNNATKDFTTILARFSKLQLLTLVLEGRRPDSTGVDKILRSQDYETCEHRQYRKRISMKLPGFFEDLKSRSCSLHIPTVEMKYLINEKAPPKLEHRWYKCAGCRACST